MRSGRWKLATELTEDEMDEALYALERRESCPCVTESYLRGESTCRIDFRLRVNQARLQHFEAEFQRLPDVADVPVALRPRQGGWGWRIDILSDGLKERTDGLVPRSSRQDDIPEVVLMGNEQDGMGDAVFVVVGQLTEQGQGVDIIAPPGVLPPIYSVVRLKAVRQSSHGQGKTVSSFA